jgi:hypothetical protein
MGVDKCQYVNGSRDEVSMKHSRRNQKRVNNERKELREFTDRGFGKELRSIRITQKSNIL